MTDLHGFLRLRCQANFTEVSYPRKSCPKKQNKLDHQRNKGQHYAPEFKLLVVEEFLAGQLSKAALCRKHGIVHTDRLREWLRIFAPEYKMESIEMNKINKERRTESEQVKELKRQLQQKELELKKEKMRTDLLNEIINVSEEEFNLPIRKKYGVKQ